MARVKLREKNSQRLVGKAIFNAWEAAIKANPKAPEIDRRALISTLNSLFDTEDKGRSGKKIEFDVVFDTDLDDQTRLVWLSIPTPDIDSAGGQDSWEKWKEQYYDNLSDAEKEEKEEQLGTAVLFGCGR